MREVVVESAAATLLVGPDWLPPALCARSVPPTLASDVAGCSCGGWFSTARLNASVPNVSPIPTSASPGPLPALAATRPRRSGSAKVVVPSPP